MGRRVNPRVKRASAGATKQRHWMDQPSKTRLLTSKVFRGTDKDRGDWFFGAASGGRGSARQGAVGLLPMKRDFGDKIGQERPTTWRPARRGRITRVWFGVGSNLGNEEDSLVRGATRVTVDIAGYVGRVCLVRRRRKGDGRRQ
jgi:hypothetical protein